MDNIKQVKRILAKVLQKHCYSYEHSELEEELEKALSLLELSIGDCVKHKYQDFQGYIVGFEGDKVSVAIRDSDREDCELLPGSTLNFFVEHLERTEVSQ